MGYKPTNPDLRLPPLWEMTYRLKLSLWWKSGFWSFLQPNQSKISTAQPQPRPRAAPSSRPPAGGGVTTRGGHRHLTGAAPRVLHAQTSSSRWRTHSRHVWTHQLLRAAKKTSASYLSFFFFPVKNPNRHSNGLQVEAKIILENNTSVK